MLILEDGNRIIETSLRGSLKEYELGQLQPGVVCNP